MEFIAPDETGIDPDKLAEIQERVNLFLEKVRESPAYDFETENADKNTALRALDSAVLLYASGGVDAYGVEQCARAYVKLCKRPAPPPQPPTYKQQRRETYNYQQMSPPRAWNKYRRNFRDLEGENREYNARLYFAGEMPPPNALPGDCVDGGGTIEQDRQLAALSPKTPAPAKPLPPAPNSEEAFVAALREDALNNSFKFDD